MTPLICHSLIQKIPVSPVACIPEPLSSSLAPIPVSSILFHDCSCHPHLVSFLIGWIFLGSQYTRRFKLSQLSVNIIFETFLIWNREMTKHVAWMSITEANRSVEDNRKSLLQFSSPVVNTLWASLPSRLLFTCPNPTHIESSKSYLLPRKSLGSHLLKILSSS